MAQAKRTRPSTRRPVRLRIGLKRVVPGAKGRFPSELSATLGIRSQMVSLEREIARVLKIIGNASEDALYEALEPIDFRSRELTPIDTGTLIESSYLETKMTSKGPEAEIGFARGGTPFYAVIVHEDLETPHEPPTQAKFLQQAVEENINNIMPIIQDFMRLQ